MVAGPDSDVGGLPFVPVTIVKPLSPTRWRVHVPASNATVG